MPEEKKKKKNGFLFSRRSGETIPTADNTREKEDKFNTAYVYYYERTNETVYQEFLLVPTFLYFL